MKHERYFLIAPKRELVARLTASSATDLMDLAEPVMWTADEYDKSRFIHADMNELVKLLFLDTLSRERGTEKSFGKIFDRWALSENFFNTWWLFQRVEVDMSVEIAVKDAIASGSLNSLREAATADVAEWLDVYRQRMKPSDLGS